MADPATRALEAVYGAISEWLLYPEEVDPETVTGEAVAGVVEAASVIAPAVVEHLRAFCGERETVTPEQYLALLELNPSCPLYLGSYQFEEPQSCSAAGVSDRNQYMLEIGNVYRHFGFEVAGELPDYVPAVAEFLSLTINCEAGDRAVRLRFAEKLVLPGARLFAEKLEGERSPYGRLARALVGCLEHELGAARSATQSPDLAGVAAGTSYAGHTDQGGEPA